MHELTIWEKRLNTQLETFFGLQAKPAALQDTLADIQTRLANQESLLKQLVATRPLTTNAPETLLPELPALEFRDITVPPIINGKIKPKLTQTQHDILMELLKAGPGGLSLEELDANSCHPEARKTLKKLAKDADWQSVMGQGGYRLHLS
ncbi:hypothetical protein BH11PLA2_BH11PLA2_16110 [soil metagenome]